VNNSTSTVLNGTRVGSLIGNQAGTVTACYAGGATYTNLRGTGSGTLTNSYYQAVAVTTESSGTASGAKLKATLTGPTGYSGIYEDWEDIDGDGTVDPEDDNDSWNFGTDKQYPVLKGIDVNKDGTINAADIAAQR